MNSQTPVSTTKTLLEHWAQENKSPLVLTAVDFSTPQPDTAPTPRRRGVKRLRPQQDAGFQALKDEPFRLYIGPTGSGKSVTGCCLADYDLRQGHKILIAVPQHSTASGFTSKKIQFLDGRGISWRPGTMPDKTTIQAVVDFVTRPPSADPVGRIMVCTHAALVRAHALLSDPCVWKGTALTIDEAHHSLYDAIEDAEDEHSVLNNKLGALVQVYLTTKPAPLTLMTATWLRTRRTIVPSHRLSLFARFAHPVDEYMAAMEHLRETKVRFIIGEPVASLRALVQADPRRKTLVFLPSISNWMPDADAKASLLAECKDAVGCVTGRTGAYELHGPEGLKTCDLVTVEGRNGGQGRLDALTSDIAEQIEALDNGVPVEQIPQNTPDIVFALNMCREGFDWPEASRAILLAPRGSVLDVIQMLGRLLRDWPGKRAVEFNIVLPVAPDGKADPEKMENYLKVIFACMVVEWQFARIELTGSRGHRKDAEKAAAVIGDLDSVAQIMAGLCEWGVSQDGDPATWDEATASVLDDVVPDLEPGPRKILQNHLERFWKKNCKRILREAQSVPLSVPLQEGLEDSPYGLLRLCSAMLGWDQLRELRLATGMMFRPLTLEYIDQKILEYAKAHGWEPEAVDRLASPVVVEA